MASLLSASSFYAGVQPTESELMPSADHGGPLLLEGVCPNNSGSPPSNISGGSTSCAHVLRTSQVSPSLVWPSKLD